MRFKKMSTINTPMVFIVDTPILSTNFYITKTHFYLQIFLLFTFCLALLTVLVVVSINVATSVLSIVKYTSIHTFNSCGLNLLVRIFQIKVAIFVGKSNVVLANHSLVLFSISLLGGHFLKSDNNITR